MTYDGVRMRDRREDAENDLFCRTGTQVITFRIGRKNIGMIGDSYLQFLKICEVFCARQENREEALCVVQMIQSDGEALKRTGNINETHQCNKSCR